jgi:hypothetical protein
MPDGQSARGLGELERANVERRLREFSESVDGVRTAVVASVDGFALAQSNPSSANGERLAAMTSAMLALAAAIGRELALGQLDVLMLESEGGKVLMLALKTEHAPLLLMAACDHRSVIGNVLWSAKECGRNVLAELGGP